jgi:hypothetical protein
VQILFYTPPFFFLIGHPLTYCRLSRLPFAYVAGATQDISHGNIIRGMSNMKRPCKLRSENTNRVKRGSRLLSYRLSCFNIYSPFLSSLITFSNYCVPLRLTGMGLGPGVRLIDIILFGPVPCSLCQVIQLSGQGNVFLIVNNE